MFRRVSPENRLNSAVFALSFGRIFGETPLTCSSAVVFPWSPLRNPWDANVKHVDTVRVSGAVALTMLLLPEFASAQQSPFDTGANSLVTFALAIATPIAILVVIGAAIAAAVGRISWGWVIGCIVGIAAIFGSPQIVAWIRGMFAV